MKKTKTLLLVLLLVFLTGCTEQTVKDSTLLDTKSALEIETELTDEELPTSLNGVTISWVSSKPGIIEDNKIIEQEVNVNTTLTASLEYEGQVVTKLFNVTIIGLYTDQNTFIDLVDSFKLLVPEESNTLIEDIELPQTYNDLNVTWYSNDSCMDTDGDINRPNGNEDDCIVTVSVTLTYKEYTKTLDYTYTVLAKTVTVTYDGYYIGADGLTGDLLKSFLHDLIDDHTVLSYSQLWDALSDSDEDPNNSNNVILLYSGRSQSKDTHGGDQNDWNREHVWPRSHGDLEDHGGPAFTDMHHIRPTDVTVNSTRGNLDFDMGGNLVSETTDSYKDSDSFEPRDEVKGDVARMIFYMAVRYEGGSGELDLELNDNVNNSGPFMGRLSILIEWHLNDLPDEFEQNRNDVIFSYQGNRNPFIDHPEFVEMIWGTN